MAKYIEPQVVEEVRKIDVLTYLKSHEPDNLVRVSANTYRTNDHDSLQISNGKWHWWSRGIGGVSALDYLIKVRDMPFLDAVELLMGAEVPAPYFTTDVKPQEEKSHKQLKLPKRNKNCNRVIAYLKSRGIDEVIIRDCIAKGILYESFQYHNVVFVGKDSDGVPRYASCRGTMWGSSFKQDVSGRDKRFSFQLVANTPITSLHVFEAAIDLLSYAIYLRYQNHDYRQTNLLSLAGVSKGMKKLPAALANFLKMHPEIQTIYLHLDNDEVGRSSTTAITQLLQNEYQVIDAHPHTGKDVNDWLLQARERGEMHERNIV